MRVVPALPRLSPSLTRPFHSSPPSRTSILFALSALSNSRETQHLNKLSHLHRIEHSPPLKLIKTSEIDPFHRSSPSSAAVSAPSSAAFTSHATLAPSDSLWNHRALAAGRAILVDNSRRMQRYARVLERRKVRGERERVKSERERDVLREKVERMEREVRSAGGWVVAAVATATALGMWRFWPENAAVKGEVGGRERREGVGREVLAVREAVEREREREAERERERERVREGERERERRRVEEVIVKVEERRRRSWWKGLFWVPEA